MIKYFAVGLVSFFCVQNHSLAQPGLKVKPLAVYETSSLEIDRGREPEMTYSMNAAMKKGRFIVCKLELTPESRDIPKIGSEDITIHAGGKGYHPIGTIDNPGFRLELKAIRWSYFGSRPSEEWLVFEIPSDKGVEMLNIAGIEVPIEKTTDLPEEDLIPNLKTKSSEIVEELERIEMSGQSEHADIRVYPTVGKFVIVDIEVTFEFETPEGAKYQRRADYQSSDFILTSTGGAVIACIGESKGGKFVSNGNAGEKSLSSGAKSKMTLVFPIGDISEDTLKDSYKLSYKGKTEANL